MKKLFLITIVLLCTMTSFKERKDHHRIYLLTDISSLKSGEGEPDDTQSLIRLLCYADEFDIEGLGATYSSYHDTIYPQHLRTVLTAYEASLNRLTLHGQYPSGKALIKKIKRGSLRIGINNIGSGMDTEISEDIIRVLKQNHKEPLWVLVWGGSIDLAQALWKIRHTMPAQQAKMMISALRVYAIGDQYDNCGAWIRSNFANLFYILNNGSYRGMYKTGDTSLVSSQWVKNNILSVNSALAQLYPDYRGRDPWGKVEGIKEGDTPSFLYLLMQLENTGPLTTLFRAFLSICLCNTKIARASNNQKIEMVKMLRNHWS